MRLIMMSQPSGKDAVVKEHNVKTSLNIRSSMQGTKKTVCDKLLSFYFIVKQKHFYPTIEASLPSQPS